MKEFNYRFFAYLGIALTLGIILVFGLFAALQPMRMHTAAREIEAEAMERGDEVFARDCATCHGGQGEGMGNIGPALNTQELPMVDLGLRCPHGRKRVVAPTTPR